MTYQELKKLNISNIIASVPEFQNLVKECLSIVSTSTLKDNEISSLIAGAVEDMGRQGINVIDNLSNGLIQNGVTMYVKAQFGYGEDDEKKRSWDSYHQICTNLSLSHDFRLEEE